MLREAVDTGALIHVPRDDWPANAIRDNRIPGFPDASEVDDATVILHLADVFGPERATRLTRLQATVLLQFLKRRETNREQLHNAIEAGRFPATEATDLKIVDVVICTLRKKLGLYFVSKSVTVPVDDFTPNLTSRAQDMGKEIIKTIPCCGYLMVPEYRKRIGEILSNHSGVAPRMA